MKGPEGAVKSGGFDSFVQFPYSVYMEKSDAIAERMARLEGEYRAFSDFARQDLGQIKGTLGQVLALLTRLDQKLADAPSAAALAELRGRVEEISRQLPKPIAYTAPGGRRKSG
jgi:muconolactone delta-isomerase